MRHALRLFAALALLTAFGLQAFAQTDSLRFVVRGVVRDASGGKPLDAVAVTIPGTAFATVTNRDGSFIIKSDTEPSYITFTLLGYNSQTVPVKAGDELRVRLNRGSLELSPATVISGDPLTLLRYAIARIDANSAQAPELFDCFYRETVQKRQRFIYVSEAVTKMYKAAPGPFGRDRAAVQKSRLLASPRPADTLGVKVIGGPVLAVDFDLVRQHDLVFHENLIPYYNFELLPPDMIDGRMQFVIGFSPAKVEDFALQYGKVYIDQITFAISRVETSLDVSDQDKATRAMLVRRPTGLRFRPKEMWMELNYKPEADGYWRLSYLRTRFRFNCDWKKRLVATDYTVVSEMVVTNRYTGADAVPIQRSEEFRSYNSLADQTKFYSDPLFWEAYNIIEPTVGLENAIERLKK